MVCPHGQGGLRQYGRLLWMVINVIFNCTKSDSQNISFLSPQSYKILPKIINCLFGHKIVIKNKYDK